MGNRNQIFHAMVPISQNSPVDKHNQTPFLLEIIDKMSMKLSSTILSVTIKKKYYIPETHPLTWSATPICNDWKWN